MPEQDPRKNADELLLQIKACMEAADIFNHAASEEIDRISKEYAAKLSPIQERLAGLEKDLVSLMKRNRTALFTDTDKVSLVNGILIYERKDKVTIPRNGLQKAIEFGLDDAIIVSKSLDRAVVEKWPGDRLDLIGATRKPKDFYSYETR